MTDDPVVLQSVVDDLVQDFPDKETMLDQLAAMAMQGIVGNDLFAEAEPDDYGRFYADRVACFSYDIAEAMIREREKRLTKGEA